MRRRSRRSTGPRPADSRRRGPLLFAVHESSPFHAAARSWLTEQFNGARSVGLPWQSLAAFLRTRPRREWVGVLERPRVRGDFARFNEVRRENPLAELDARGIAPWPANAESDVAPCRTVEPWREAVWRAVPEGAVPERFAPRRAFLLGRVRGGERVLDLGCGDGAFAAELVAVGCLVTAVDVAEEAVRRARARVPAADVRRVAEGAALPFTEDAFDVVWAGEVLEHVADVAGLLAEVRRVLRWDGTLVATMPYHGRVSVAALALRGRLEEHFDPRADHLRFFTARSLRAVLEEAGFRDVEVDAVGGVPPLRQGLHAVGR